MRECTKKTPPPSITGSEPFIPECGWRVAGSLCSAPEDIDCHYAEPLLPIHLNRLNDQPGDQAEDLAAMRQDLEKRKEEKQWS